MDNYSKFFILPQDGGVSILNLINSAQNTICITMYQLYDDIIQDALIALANKGVKIRLIYDSEQHSKEDIAILCSEEKFSSSHPNIQGVPSSNIFSHTHEKSIIVDGKVIAILTLNIVGKGKYDSFSDSRDFGIVTNVKADVLTLMNQFELDWANATLGNKDLFPKIEPGTRLFFSPSSISDPNNSYNVILDLLSNAKKSIDIYTEIFGNKTTDVSTDFTDILNEQAEKGVKIRIISPLFMRNFKPLNNSIKTIQPPDGLSPYFHAKSIIVDNSAATVMSVNFENASIFFEREAGILITDLDIVSQLSEQFDADWIFLLKHQNT